MDKKHDSGLSCFLIVMKFLGIPITKEQAEKLAVLDETQKTGEIEIIQSAKALKLHSKICKLNIRKLKDIRFPIIAKDKEGEFFIVAKSQEDKFMVLFSDKTQPEVKTREELAEIWDGTSVVITKKGILDWEAVFSFKWFIPTILKYKKEFIQVLIAVFTVQILGILTPVMTQVVVDKVLVHKSISTLNIITIGIAVVYIYDLIISLAKNYVFTHTTNRIDVMLSYKLFRHLFALPLKYFESRRVGETVARVRELDSIRNFLTGTPLSSMIDFVFIIVYIVVLFLYSSRH
ncbi:MAG: ABC transporter transmembrane domain-containing protein [Oscillospiraceae bacterium]